MTDDDLSGAPQEVIDAYQGLTGKLRQFAVLLATEPTQLDAAIKAGYSPKTAKANASAYANQPSVKLVADYLIGNSLRKSSITLERCMAELAKLAFGDPKALFDEDGALRPPHEWPADSSAMIVEVQQTDLYAGVGADREKIGVVNKLKFGDKHAALRTAFQLLDAYPDKKKKVTHTHRIGVAVVPAKVKSVEGHNAQVIEGQAIQINQPAKKMSLLEAMSRKASKLEGSADGG